MGDIIIDYVSNAHGGTECNSATLCVVNPRPGRGAPRCYHYTTSANNLIIGALTDLVGFAPHTYVNQDSLYYHYTKDPSSFGTGIRRTRKGLNLRPTG